MGKEFSRKARNIRYYGDEEFMIWYNSLASEDEIQLTEKANKFEELFKDFQFSELEPRPMELDTLIQAPLVVKVRRLRNKAGCVRRTRKAINIDYKHKDMDDVLLHEMIHIYVDIIEQFPEYNYLYEYLLLYLYRKLSKVEELQPIIDGLLAYGDPWHLHTIQNQGGKHNILFILKSLDIDIAQGYKLGTTMGYDFQDFFKVL